MDIKKDTISTLCPYSRRCGGCQLKQSIYPSTLHIKRQRLKRLLSRFGHVDGVVGAKEPICYRNKAQAMFFSRGGEICSGLYQAHEKRAMALDRCLLQKEGADAIIKTVRDLCPRFKIKPYDVRTKKGYLRHVLVRHGEATGEIMVVLVTAEGSFPSARSFVNELIRRHSEITTVVHNVNKTSTPLFLGSESEVLWGKGYIEDRLLGLSFRISPCSFYQINHAQTECLYSKVAEFANVKEGERVLDAYCGTGTIGLCTQRGKGELVGVELSESAVSDARINAELNGVKNACFICADAEKYMQSAVLTGEHFDVVITDPPRAGCSREFLMALLKLSPERVVYVSCNPETLARDLGFLTKNGYKAEKIQGVDMFPFTEHVESVVLLSREKVKTMEDSTMLCDMHLHSNCSDGSFPPEELINEAKKEGIKAIALCDHNTVTGLTRFVNTAKGSGVLAVPGVEITSAYKGNEVHIVGLFLKENKYPAITEYLEQINTRKIESNQLLAKRLNEGGFAISYEAVLNIAGYAIPNRVHFAKALLEKGYVFSVSEAFETILAEDGEFYKPAEKLDSLDVIRFLRSVGAVPVLAHPFLNFSLEELKVFLPKAKKCGLVGMEIIYPLFSKEETALAINLVEEYGLIPRGGSDFHGTNKPEIKMGRGKDNIAVPYRFYENLKKVSDSLPKQITD